jgi:hypothetical protein
MNPETDLGPVVTDWLRADASSSGSDTVLAATLVRVATVRQDRRRPAWVLPSIRPALKFAALSAAVIGVVLIAGNLPTSNDGVVGRSTTPVISPIPSRSPESTFQVPTDGRDHGSLDPGGFLLRWPLGPTDAGIRVTVPDGWAWGDYGAMVYRDHGRLYGFPADLQTHAVTRVVTSVCALDQANEVGPLFVEVGPTVDELTTAISNVVGTHWSNPTDVTVDGYPAKRLVSTYAADCEGPTRRTIWANDVSGFFVEEGARDTIYVIDVDGKRLVITTEERNASPALTGELEAIMASIDIEPGEAGASRPIQSPAAHRTGRFPEAVGPDADLRVGRHQAIVADTPFSFVVPTSGWETQLGFYISKSTTGPQGAEGTIRWTTLPNGLDTDACPQVLDDSTSGSADDVASHVARAPGVNLVSGPMGTTIDRHPTAHLVVDVEADLGCDPGYFYSYAPLIGGALWTDTKPGDRIMVWIVEVDGKLLFIEAELHDEAIPGLEGQVREIVNSMRFE